MNPRNTALILRHYGTTDFITGLRAIAAILVVAIHTGAFRDFGPLGDNLTNNGKYGVQMFFVISGFTVAATFTSAPSFRSYFTRRFFRIAPIYYLLFALIIFTRYLAGTSSAVDTNVFGIPYEIYDAILHLTFLNGWDARTATSLMGVEWTIQVEMFWYAFLPLLIPLTKTRSVFWLSLPVLILFSAASQTLGNQFFFEISGKYFPTSHGAYFFFGVASWRYRLRNEGSENKTGARYSTAGVLLLTVALFLPTINALTPIFVAVATALILAGFKQKKSGGVLSSKVAIFLGSISYSIYLLHILVVGVFRDYILPVDYHNGLIFFVIVTAVTVLLSTITYLFVEKPTNLWGKSIASRMAVRA